MVLQSELLSARNLLKPKEYETTNIASGLICFKHSLESVHLNMPHMHELLCSLWRYSPEQSSTYYVFFQKYLLTSSLTPVSSQVPEQRGHPVTFELWGHRHRKEKCPLTVQCAFRQTYSRSLSLYLSFSLSLSVQEFRDWKEQNNNIHQLFCSYHCAYRIFTTPNPFASFIFSFLPNSLSLPLLCEIDFLLFSSSWPWEASGPD